jgi:hypothetical protein
LRDLIGIDELGNCERVAQQKGRGGALARAVGPAIKVRATKCKVPTAWLDGESIDDAVIRTLRVTGREVG